MELYGLPITIEEPSEDSGGKYVAELPEMAGCRAWGDSATEAVVNLRSVAAAFVESYHERGDALPEGFPEESARMDGVITKQDFMKSLDGLPEDATIEDAIERLYVLRKIERGLREVAEGKTMSLEEAKARLRKWAQ